MDEEVLLQCTQRSLPFTVVKVGQVLSDDKKWQVSDRTKGRVEKDSPLVFARPGSVVEYSEVTGVTIAAEALLRATGHPHRNATFSVFIYCC